MTAEIRDDPQAASDLPRAASSISGSHVSAPVDASGAARAAAVRLRAKRVAAATRSPALARMDLPELTAASPLHRPTVTGAAASRARNHVGGGLLPADDTVALSDGTRISFAAVEEVPVLSVEAGAGESR